MNYINIFKSHKAFAIFIRYWLDLINFKNLIGFLSWNASNLFQSFTLFTNCIPNTVSIRFILTLDFQNTYKAQKRWNLTIFKKYPYLYPPESAELAHPYFYIDCSLPFKSLRIDDLFLRQLWKVEQNYCTTEQFLYRSHAFAPNDSNPRHEQIVTLLRISSLLFCNPVQHRSHSYKWYPIRAVLQSIPDLQMK